MYFEIEKQAKDAIIKAIDNPTEISNLICEVIAK